MARQYYGVGQVVYGQHRGCGVFANDRATYLVIGLGGDAYNDPKVEIVLSQDSVKDYKLVSQIEANANSSAVLGATFWLGIGAGLLASQMGKHTEYTVELTYFDGTKSQVVLVNDGYSILMGSMSIGAPEIQLAQARLNSANKTRTAISDSLSAQISALHPYLAELGVIPNSNVAGTVAGDLVLKIKDRINLLKNKMSELALANDTAISTISDSSNSSAGLISEAKYVIAAYKQYSEEYKEPLSQLNRLRRERDISVRSVGSIEEKQGRDYLKKSVRNFILLTVALAYTAFMIWCWIDETGINRYGRAILKPEAGTVFATIFGGVFCLLFLALFISSIIAFVHSQNSSTAEEKEELKTQKVKANILFNDITAIEKTIPSFDNWYNQKRK